ncbi:MAG: hypothetical protein FJ313_03955, partial [Gemmatimonadetes bacterium]|nr:hypothetical protein [Gemmatimonadota bacterium]
EVELADVPGLIESGEIRDAKTIASLLRFLTRQGGAGATKPPDAAP